MSLIYSQKTASQNQIEEYLKACDTSFTPPLSSRVSLLAYSNKIFEQSETFEAWDKNTLVGLISAYFNDAEHRAAFITHVGVLQHYTGQGTATALLGMCLQYGLKQNFSEVRLEVSRTNSPAIKLYAAAGFTIIDELRDNCLMEYEFGSRADSPSVENG